MLLSTSITIEDIKPPDYTNEGLPLGFPQHALIPGRQLSNSNIVDLHLALRKPCNLVRIDQASYNLKSPSQKESLDRILADGILGYSMVITDPVMCGYQTLADDQSQEQEQQVAMGVAYIWDQFYVGEKGMYEEHEIISILFYHLHQLRKLDSRPELVVKLHASKEIRNICDDRGMGNILELVAAVCSAQNLMDTWLIPTFQRVLIVVDTIPSKHEDPANYEISSTSLATNNAAVAAVESIDQAEANVPTFMMGNESRANFYTGIPLPGETQMTRDDMKELSNVSDKIAAVVTCARISTNGKILSNTIKFHKHIGHELAQQMYTSAMLMQGVGDN